MKKIFLLAVCLLSLLACTKRPAPAPVEAPPAILPQFAQLNDLYRQFQGFRNDRLYLRHGFTANFPQSDWLQQVRDLGQDPDLSERARLLASLAMASRIHGDSSQVTRSFEKRFTASLHTPGPPLPEKEEAAETGADAGLDAQSPRPPATQALNASEAVSAETSRTDDIAAPEKTEHRQHAEPTPSNQPASQTALRPPEELAPATSPGVEARTVSAQPDTVAPAGDTPIEPPASPDTPPLSEKAPQPATNPPETDAKITVLFTGDTQGVVYPQPGITGTVGGIARRLSAIERIRSQAEALVLLDAGDAFVSGSSRAERINKTLVRAMNRMRYDAMGLGPYDLDMGEVTLRELASIAAFPFVCSNLEFQTDALPWIKPYVLIERGRHTIAVISLIDPDPAVKITGARFIAPELAMNKLMPQLASKADAVVLLTQVGREEILPILGAVPEVNVILGDARSVYQDTPRYIPAVAKGMGMGLVELSKSDGVFRTGRSIPLVASGVSDPNLLRMLDEIQN